MTKIHSRGESNMDILQRFSLKSLYIFSVAAKHLNFSKAAIELSITASAVSHQISRLEESLGCPLFIREGKYLLLSPEAQQYAVTINQCFNEIRQSTKDFMVSDSKVIHFGVNGAFAVKRLTQELGLWQEKNPQLDLRLRMISCDDNLASLNLDVILSGSFNDKRYHARFICDESYYPVCHKSLYETLTKASLQELLNTTTLLDLDAVNVWSLWGEAKQLALPSKGKISYFSHTLLLIQATLAGQGIALLDKSLIKNELASGELILLDDKAYHPPDAAYCLSTKKQWLTNENIKSLEKWVVDLFE
mgnify:CR=1 FL=1